MEKRKVPQFGSEQEEAAWWDRNRAELDQDFLRAAQEGRLQRLGRDRLKARLSGAAKSVSLQLSEEDWALAREQAAQQGVPYEAYLNSLLHQALHRAG